MEASAFILDMQTVPHGMSKASFVWLRFDGHASMEVIIVRKAVKNFFHPG